MSSALERFPACLLILAAAACDPVLDDGVAALGGNTPGVRNGPLHRPGEPCLLCHDGALGDPPAFSAAGTIFQFPTSTQPAVGATVTLTDFAGTTQNEVTNAAGNFFIPAEEWTPVFPLQVYVTPATGMPVRMLSQVEGSSEILGGSCATCHANPAGPDSPGQVCVTLNDGGTPR